RTTVPFRRPRRIDGTRTKRIRPDERKGESVMRAARRKAIAGALFAALFLAGIALAGNNPSGTSTQSAALNVGHMSGPASQFASSTGSTKGTPAAPSKGANPQGITVGRSYKNAISP